MSCVEIVGYSGSGKTSAMRGVLQGCSGLVGIRGSVTTRPERPTDIPGEYWYLRDSVFEELKKGSSGTFAWTIKANGFQYGTLQSELDRALQNDDKTYLCAMIPSYIRNSRAFALAAGRVNRIQYLHIEVPSEVAAARMQARGDSGQSIEARLRLEASWPTEIAELEASLGISFHRIDGTQPLETVVEQARQYIVS